MSAAVSLPVDPAMVPRDEYSGNTPDGDVVELDVLLSDIRRLQRLQHDAQQLQHSADETQWEIGNLLAQITEGRLWERRTNEDGGQQYGSFKEFLQVELPGLRYAHAKQIAKAASLGRPAFEKYGLRQVASIARAPAEARAGLFAKIDQGATTEEVETLAKAARPARADGQRGPGRPSKPTLHQISIETTASDDGCFAVPPTRLPDGATNVKCVFIFEIEPAGAAP